MADDTEVPVVAPETEAAPEAPEVEATEVPEAPAAEAAPAEGNETAGDPPEPRGTRRWQKRVDKLTHRLREMEAVLHEQAEAIAARTPVQEPAKPKAESFQTYEEYLEALVDYKAERRAAPEAQAQRQQAPRVELADDAEESLDNARERIKDYDAVVFDPNIVIAPAWVQALADSKVMGDVVYHLAKHQDEAKALARLPIAAQVRELGRLESRIEAQIKASGSKPAPQPSGAPAPISPVKPVAQARKDLSDPNLPDADFDRMLREKRRKR